MRFGPDVLLRLRVGVPEGGGETLRASMELVLNAMMREVIGPSAAFQVAVEYTEDGDDPTS